MNECETDLKTDTENALKKAINKITILEAKNELLEEQIEKMKCCENCKHHCFWGNELNCRDLSYDEELKCMKTKEHWEIKENDR